MLWVFVIGVWVDRHTRYIFWLSMPTLDPISSTRILLSRRRERQEEREFLRGMRGD